MNKIVLASNNQGKVKEISALLAELGFEVITQREAGVIEEIEETGLTFVENAILKARYAAKISGLPAIADDSGIEVDALSGAPGIYSARFSGAGATDEKNNQKLLEKLAGLPAEKRTARYQCLLVFMRHAEDPVPLITQGSFEGVILESPRGDNGFGYDPLFYVPTHNCSAAELDPAEKNRISHRAIALRRFVEAFHAN